MNIVGKFPSSVLWEQRWDPNGEEKFWAALTPPGVPQGWMGYGGPKPKNFFSVTSISFSSQQLPMKAVSQRMGKENSWIFFLERRGGTPTKGCENTSQRPESFWDPIPGWGGGWGEQGSTPSLHLPYVFIFSGGGQLPVQWDPSIAYLLPWEG